MLVKDDIIKLLKEEEGSITIPKIEEVMLSALVNQLRNDINQQNLTCLEGKIDSYSQFIGLQKKITVGKVGGLTTIKDYLLIPLWNFLKW